MCFQLTDSSELPWMQKSKVLLWQQQQIMEIIRKIKARLREGFYRQQHWYQGYSRQHCGQFSISEFNGERQRHRPRGKRLSPKISNKRLAFPHPGNHDKDRFRKTAPKLPGLWTSECSSHSGITKANVAFLIAVNKLDLFSRAVQMSEPLLNWPRGRRIILMMYDKTCIRK